MPHTYAPLLTGLRYVWGLGPCRDASLFPLLPLRVNGQRVAHSFPARSLLSLTGGGSGGCAPLSHHHAALARLEVYGGGGSGVGHAASLVPSVSLRRGPLWPPCGMWEGVCVGSLLSLYPHSLPPYHKVLPVKGLKYFMIVL